MSAARQAVEVLDVEPTMEDVVRALYGCLERTGDRAGLIREDRRLREALRAELADPDDPDDDPDLYGPSPETVELFEAIIERLAGNARTRSETEAPLLAAA